MTTAVQRDNRRKGLLIILGIIALGVLLLIAAAALGYTVGIPWLDNMSGNAGRGGGAMAASNGGGAGGGGETASNANCFLGLICVDANSDVNGSNTNASVDDDGVGASGN